MGHREINAMKTALAKYPQFEPYYKQMESLCFPGVAGIDVRENETINDICNHTGIPWTIQIIQILKNVMPKELAIMAPSFIIEAQRAIHAGTDYSSVFSDDPDVIFLEKITEKLSINYYFLVKNKALVVEIKDYMDHLYIHIEGLHDDLELTPGEWPQDKKERCKRTYDAWNSVVEASWFGDRGNVTICRGNIRKDIERAKAVISSVKPYISPDISKRMKAYCVRYLISKDHTLNWMPEIV